MISKHVLENLRNSGLSESEIQHHISVAEKVVSKKTLTVAELKELGINTDGEMVISFGQRRKSK